MTTPVPLADHHFPRPSLLGSVPVVLCLATVGASIVVVPPEVWPFSERRLFFTGWLTVAAVFAAIAAVPGSPLLRSVSGTIAAVGMVAGGAAALLTVGLPVAIAGVIEALYVLSFAETATARSSRAWPLLIAAAVGTVVAFAAGLGSTPP